MDISSLKSSNNFSVLMSTYKGDSPFFLQESLKSLVTQTLLPNEIVIVEDGPLNVELYAVLEFYEKQNLVSINRIKLEVNQGLGKALKIGLENCKYEFVARMDSDDVCVKDRFEKLISYFIEHHNIDVLGSYMEEFNVTPGDLKVLNTQPLTHNLILKKSKFLNPISHPSVMFKKSKIISVGSYEDMPLFEDYYLWIRLLRQNVTFANIPDILIYFRIGNDMIGRRHGISYLKKEMKFYFNSFKLKHINIFELAIIISLKSIIRLFPKKILSIVYRKFARN